MLARLYVHVHFQVFPQPNVMFTLFRLFYYFLFRTPTTAICNRKGKNHPRSLSSWLEERLVCMFLFTFNPPFCSHSRFYRPLPYFPTPFNVSLIPQWIKARLNCYDPMKCAFKSDWMRWTLNISENEHTCLTSCISSRLKYISWTVFFYCLYFPVFLQNNCSPPVEHFKL